MTSLRIVPEHAVSVRIVLVQPRNPLNILAAARAARNFGLGDIAVVEVQPRAWAEALEKDVDRETPHGPRATSRGWLGDARKFDTLLEAIGDCDWVLGTSSLERRKVKRGEVIELPALPARLAEACGLAWPGEAVPAEGERESDVSVAKRSRTGGAARRSQTGGAAKRSAAMRPHGGGASFQSRLGKAGRGQGAHSADSGLRGASRLPASAPLTAVARRRVAILFGSEKRGLTNEHLMYCQHLLRIPTVEEKPSMNLGQAVAVVCYELARHGVPGWLEPLGGAGPGGSRRPHRADRGASAAETELATGAEFSTEAADTAAAEFSADSAAAKFAAGAVVAEFSAGAAQASLTEFEAPSEVAEFAVVAEESSNAEKSSNAEEAASAREKQALADQIGRLLGRPTVSNEIMSFESEIGTKHRNLIKMLNRLPLTSEDVRRILKLLKEGEAALHGATGRPRQPQMPRKPRK